MQSAFKAAWSLLAFFMAGCHHGPEESQHRCGSPCPHISPTSISKASLLESYRASALGRDLAPEAQIAAARALQDLLRTGDYRHDGRWQLPNLPEYDGSPKGRFSLVGERSERAAACITYRQEITFPKKTVIGHGKACRTPSGLWRIIEEFPYGTR